MLVFLSVLYIDSSFTTSFLIKLTGATDEAAKQGSLSLRLGLG